MLHIAYVHTAFWFGMKGVPMPSSLTLEQTAWKQRTTAAAAFIAILILLATSCSRAPESPTSTALQTDYGEVETAVANLTENMVDEIGVISTGAPIIVGTPMEFELDGDFPDEGVRLEKTYAAPLQEDMMVTFIYWDDEFSTWFAVPTEISADGSSVSAQVHHFSIWTDVITGTHSAVENFASAVAVNGQRVIEWATDPIGAATDLHWFLGKSLTTRVDAPQCASPVPSWVEDSFYLDGENDPIRFCVGHDPDQPDNLQVKARINRGFGFAGDSFEPNQGASIAFGTGVVDMVDVVGGLDKELSNSVASVFGDGPFVGAGQEFSVSFSQSDLTSLGFDPVLSFDEPTVLQFSASLVAQQLVIYGLDQAEAGLAAMIAVASCASDVVDIDGSAAAFRALLTCVSESKDVIIQAVASSLTESGLSPAVAKQRAGALVGRISLLFALAPAMLSSFDYVGEALITDSARGVTLIMTTPVMTPSSEPDFISCDDYDIECDDYGNILGEDEAIQCGQTGVECDQNGNIVSFNGRPVKPDVDSNFEVQSESDITWDLLASETWCPELYPTECFTFSELLSEFPDAQVESVFAIGGLNGVYGVNVCVSMGMGQCMAAARDSVIFVSPGVEWDCDAIAREELGLKGCVGSFADSSSHLSDQPRIIRGWKNSDDDEYWEPSYPHYRQSYLVSVGAHA